MTADQQTTPITVSEQRCEDLLRQIVSIRSVVGEDTTAHLWMTARMRELGMTVEHYAVESRRTPLVLGVLEGDGTEPGVLFDAHYDTVGAIPGDWSRDPWTAHVEDGVLYGRGAVDSKGSLVAMLAAVEALVASGAPRGGPIYFMSDSDGEDSFRGATYMADLGVIDRLGTVISAEATSNHAVEIAYPGIATWKITAIGRTAHPTEPERGINAIAKMAAARQRGRAGQARAAARRFAVVQAARHHERDPHASRRRLGDPGSLRRGALDALAPRLDAERRARGDRGVPAQARGRGRRGASSSCKLLPMGAGRLWLRPGEVDPDHEGVKALEAAVQDVTGAPAIVREFNGGWVDAAELMRPDERGFGVPAAITFGPGDFEQAHQVDEHITLAEVARAAEIYARATRILLA